MNRRITIPFALCVAALIAPAMASAKPGDIYVADQTSSSILRVTPKGGVSVVASGAPLTDPAGVAVAPNGMLYVADDDAPGSGGGDGVIFKVNPRTGKVKKVASGPEFEEPTGIIVLPNGRILVADEEADGGLVEDSGSILEVTPRGAVRTIAVGLPIVDPVDLELLPNGNLLVADDGAADLGAVLTINRVTGTATPFSSGPLFDHTTGLVRRNDGITFVIDDRTSDSDVLQVVRVTRQGSASVVHSGPPLTDSRNGGIALDFRGRLLVAQNDAGPAPGIYRFPPGGVPVLAAGGPKLPDPNGLAIDPPRCGGKRSTQFGSIRRDRIRGTSFGDVIHGLGRADRISGMGNGDRICGGAGRDRLAGNNGRDVLRGGPGNDILRGGSGFDICIGGPGRDRYRGCERIRS